MADEAPEVEVRGRDQQHQRGQQRPPAAQLAPQQVGQQHGRRAEEGRAVARAGVAIADEEEDRRRHVEEERAVHQRVVLVALPDVVHPGVERVQALVVVQRLRAEVEEAHQQRQQPEQRVERHLQRDARPARPLAGSDGRLGDGPARQLGGGDRHLRAVGARAGVEDGGLAARAPVVARVRPVVRLTRRPRRAALPDRCLPRQVRSPRLPDRFGLPVAPGHGIAARCVRRCAKGA